MSIQLPYYSFTPLFFTLLFNYPTVLFSTVSLLFYSFTFLLNYSTIISVSILLLFYSLLFYLTLLFFYFSILLLFYSTIFYALLCDVVRISEVSQLNFLWLWCLVWRRERERESARPRLINIMSFAMKVLWRQQLPGICIPTKSCQSSFASPSWPAQCRFQTFLSPNCWSNAIKWMLNR